VLKAYAIGFLGAVLAIAVAGGIWLVTRPAEEPGLVWGGTVYSSKQEFTGYLKSKGLSYKTWLARNPGVAPWEPAARPQETVATTASPGRTPERSATPAREDEGPASSLPLTRIGLIAATVGALLLLLRMPHPALPRVPRGSTARATVRFRSAARAARAPRALPRIRPPRLGVSAATRRLGVIVPRYSARVVKGVQLAARHVPRFMLERNISVGDVMFGLVTVIAAGTLGLFVVLLFSA
jgi:hypothetical protein